MSINELHHLRELYRFAELGRMSATLLHEISNPLTAAIINLELGDTSSPAVKRARRNMQLLRRYIEAVRQQVRGQSLRTSFMVGPQLEQVKQVMRPLAVRAQVKLVFKPLPAPYQLQGDPVKFQQIVANLVANAIQSYAGMPKSKAEVTITVRQTRRQLILSVADHGKGISSAALPQVFDMFYSTKGRQGLGFGLALVKQYMANDFSGTIAAASSQARGTCFKACFPLSAKKPALPKL